MAMTISEKGFQIAVKYGGMVLAISIVGNVYFVLRFREVYRDRLRAEQRVQQLAAQQQIFEGVIREFVPRAVHDPKIAGILERDQVITNTRPATTNQPRGAMPTP